MKTIYRIREHRCSNDQSVFYLEETVWWWPFWWSAGAILYSCTAPTLEEARETIRSFQARDAVTCKNIIHNP